MSQLLKALSEISQGFLLQLKCVAQLLSNLDLRFCSLVLFYRP